jgi:hypothetical protein
MRNFRQSKGLNRSWSWTLPSAKRRCRPPSDLPGQGARRADHVAGAVGRYHAAADAAPRAGSTQARSSRHCCGRREFLTVAGKPKVGLRAQVKLRLSAEERAELKALADGQRVSVSQLLRFLVARELGDASLDVRGRRDESVIRDAAILIAVEQVLKLQEASIPGGITRSRQLLDAAAEAAMARLATAEEVLSRQESQ